MEPAAFHTALLHPLKGKNPRLNPDTSAILLSILLLFILPKEKIRL